VPFKQTAVCALQAYGCGQAWTAASTHTLYTPNVPAPGEVAKRNAVIMTGPARSSCTSYFEEGKERREEKKGGPALGRSEVEMNRQLNSKFAESELLSKTGLFSKTVLYQP